MIEENRTRTNNILEVDENRKSGFVKAVQLVLPVLLMGVFLFSVHLFISNTDSFKMITLLAAYYVPPSGKESIIPLATSIGIHPLAITIGITVNDLLVSLFIIWNLPYLKRIPYLGRALGYTERKGKELAEEYTSFKRIEFIFLLLFIAFPFKGSGGVAGTLLGLILGMHPYKVLLAMALGTFFGALAIAYLSDILWGILPIAPWDAWLIVVSFIELLVLIRMAYANFYVKRQG